MTHAPLPLKGVKVLDFTQVQFGPTATQVLGDFGADIVKVERPGQGDISRTTDPFITEPGGESAYFMALNRNKRSLALDMRDARGRDIARRLAMQADVLVHNFRPGVIERLGLGYQDLKQDNPRLIFASGSGFGLTGPLAHKAGQDLLAQSMSGLAARNIDDTGQAQLFPTALGDFSAGMILVQGILLALIQRAQTGEGQELHLSILDTLLTMQQQEVTQWLLRRKEVNWVRQYLMQTFRTRDGLVTLVGVFRPNPLADVCKALDLEDLSRQPRFADRETQMAHRAELMALLAEGFARYDTEEVLRRLDEADVLAAPVLSLDQALSHPQVALNGILVDFEHPVHGTVRTPGTPLHLSAVPELPRRPAPRLGEHSLEVVQSLGLTAAEIDALQRDGVIA